LVYYYYRKWSSLGGFDLLLNNLRKNIHKKTGQKYRKKPGYHAKCFFPEVVVNGDKVKGFKPIGKRWVVERTFS